MTLIDSNIVIDVLSNDPKWLHWSLDALDARAASDRLIINDVIYAELSAQSQNEAGLDEALAELGIEMERMPKSALFLAGSAFARHRKAGGVRTGVLPDFFIGAHAQAAKLPLLTRDVGRYRSYFPKVKLIAPNA